MILGVDIGGTKTLLGVFDEDNSLLETQRFETPQSYPDFLDAFKQALGLLEHRHFIRGVAAVPGFLDRKSGTVVRLGNLPWQNVSIRDDLSMAAQTTFDIENDAKLAGLYEARQLQPIPDRVLYVTVSTGISSGLIYKGKLDEGMIDSESGQMLLPSPDGTLASWESFASGKAIYAKYGMRAADITDPAAWSEIAENIALGLIELCAVIEPDVIVIGGGVGTHFKKYEALLLPKVTDRLSPMVRRPLIRGATNAEQAALLGCLEYAKDKLIA